MRKTENNENENKMERRERKSKRRKCVSIIGIKLIQCLLMIGTNQLVGHKFDVKR